MNKILLVAVILLANVGLIGQEFVLQGGSDGSDGALEVTEDQTLKLPPDGIFNFTTVTISDGATLFFERNALNTPVYLLATDDVDISGNINVSGADGSRFVGGKGGPGGFDGGLPGFTSDLPPGAGFGPGGGKAGLFNDRSANGAGAGAFRTTPTQGGSTVKSTLHGETYGNPLLRPLIGGSGGGGAAGSPGVGGGGGGGALLLGSSTKIRLFGSIFSEGGDSASGEFVDNAGSGGAIRLVAPTIEGRGSVRVGGGGHSDSSEVGSNQGGAGRIRIDAFESLGAKFMSFGPSTSLTAGSSVFVFPQSRLSLGIVSAAGNDIAPGTEGPVRLNLPFDAPTTQNVRLRAGNFGRVVPVSVMVTPAHGDSTEYQAEIDNSANNPAEVEISVEIPTNVQVTLQVWTR